MGITAQVEAAESPPLPTIPPLPYPFVGEASQTTPTSVGALMTASFTPEPLAVTSNPL